MCKTKPKTPVAIISVFLIAMLAPATAAGTITYVDSNAPGANNGSSWADAYNSLQDALAAANSAPKPVEIRVAEGIYKPDQGAGITPGDRTATFQLISGVTLKGGYAGFGEPDPDARDVNAYKTILSGDLNGNDIEVNEPRDLLNNPTRAENSYNVVTADYWTDSTAVLDGFTITAGNANGEKHPYWLGGGIHNSYDARPTVRNCTLTSNSGVFGGAIFNYGNMTVLNCIFGRNSAERFAGGMFNGYYCQPELSNCNFRQNWAGWYGGALYNDYDSDPCLINCTVTNNSAKSFGGGMYIGSVSSPIMTNCLFSGNVACKGGAIFQLGKSRMKLTNCTLSDNCATKYGGAIYNCCDWGSWSKPTLTNCILWNNRDSDGTDESAQIHREDSGTMVVTFSCIQGWTRKLRGNIDVDPCFVEPGYWADKNDPNIVIEPNDPNAIWVDGDYHVKSQAGRWDVNEGRWTKDEVTSPCIDAGDPKSPIGYELFPNGGIINMGAYGGTAEASKSYFGEPVCETPVAGDINGDCMVNFLDFRLMALHWLQDENH